MKFYGRFNRTRESNNSIVNLHLFLINCDPLLSLIFITSDILSHQIQNLKVFPKINYYVTAIL